MNKAALLALAAVAVGHTAASAVPASASPAGDAFTAGCAFAEQHSIQQCRATWLALERQPGPEPTILEAATAGCVLGVPGSQEEAEQKCREIAPRIEAEVRGRQMGIH